jgi:sterol desaturase/sphingolipid hydroxylase (fatty acid hydroxylase superfamily)
MLPWLDRIFGTHYMPPAEWPMRYGTGTPVGSTLAEQVLDPLLPGYRAGTGDPARE